MEALHWYEENSLSKDHNTPKGRGDEPEAELRRGAYLHFLQRVGMDADARRQFDALLGKGPETTAQQIRMLRKYRYRLLEEIHGKQQLLDQLDYLIYEIKNQKLKKEAQHK